MFTNNICVGLLIIVLFFVESNYSSTLCTTNVFNIYSGSISITCSCRTTVLGSITFNALNEAIIGTFSVIITVPNEHRGE